MSATELAVVLRYVVLLQQQVQQLQSRVEALESISSTTDHHLLHLQASHVHLQTKHADLRSDHDCLSHQVRLALHQALEDAANLKSLALEDPDYCEQRLLEDYWSQRSPEAFL